jgi:putative membrane protein
MRSFDLVSAELVAFELLALLFPLVLLAALYFVVRAAVRSGVSGAMGGARGTGASTKETLDRRYASGEITREDYLNIRDDITRDGDA